MLRGQVGFLVDTAINGDYMVAFECLTVIENLKEAIAPELAAPEIKKLSSALGTAPEKDPIYEGMIRILQDFIIGG